MGEDLKEIKERLPRAEIFPEGEREFFYKVVDAQVTFETEQFWPGN